jgi:hypothetical protein|tara:strand:- start:990 stop:1331 length:342 start_codon:yes stop_codon:yes gene_type:complete
MPPIEQYQDTAELLLEHFIEQGFEEQELVTISFTFDEVEEQQATRILDSLCQKSCAVQVEDIGWWHKRHKIIAMFQRLFFCKESLAWAAQAQQGLYEELGIQLTMQLQRENAV